MGVLSRAPPPPVTTWAAGIVETTSNGFGGPATKRRLVLRDARSNPDRGLIFELFEPVLARIEDPYLRFRGIEAVSLGEGQLGGMVQEWLVLLHFG